MPSQTFDANTEGGWADCYDAVYANAADGSGTLASGDEGTAGAIGQYIPSDYRCRQTLISWDTSAIPDGAIIISATITLNPSGDYTTTDFVMESFAFDFGTSVVDADFRSDSWLASATRLAYYDTTDGWTGDEAIFTSESALLAAINKTGKTRLVFASQEQRLTSAPTGDEWGYASINDAPAAKLFVEWESSVYVRPDADLATTGWSTAPLWSKVDDDPDNPDGTTITASI